MAGLSTRRIEGSLASALARDGVLFRDHQAGYLTLTEIVDTNLRMSKLGLIWDLRPVPEHARRVVPVAA